MRVKLLIAMALASIFILAGTVTAIAGTGQPSICDVQCFTPVCAPCPIVPPCVVTPGVCEVQLAQCHAPVCNVQCDCPSLFGTITLTAPSGVGFIPPNFACPSAFLTAPTFTCPILFDP